MKAATPMLATVIAVVRKCELLPISLRMENICGDPVSMTLGN